MIIPEDSCSSPSQTHSVSPAVVSIVAPDLQICIWHTMLLIIRDSSRVCWCSWGLSCVCQLLSKYIGIINLPLRECQSWFVLLFCFVVSGPHNNRSHVQIYKDLIQLWIQIVAYIQSFNPNKTSICDCITYFNCLLSVAVSVIPLTVISHASTSDSIPTTTSPPTPEYTSYPALLPHPISQISQPCLNQPPPKQKPTSDS